MKKDAAKRSARKAFTPVELLACQPTCPPKLQRRWKPWQRQARKAFTLVELLVVVAIISILAALLLPSLRKTLFQARKSASVNNMRQIMIGISLYAGENNGIVPNFPALGTLWGYGGNGWTGDGVPVYSNGGTSVSTVPSNELIGDLLPPYLNKKVNVFMAPNHWQHILSTYKRTAPSWAFDGHFSWYEGIPGKPWAGGGGMSTSYAYMTWASMYGTSVFPIFGWGGATGRGISCNFREGQPIFSGSPWEKAYNSTAILSEIINQPGNDNDPSDYFKSVNYYQGQVEGGNVAWGDGSVSYVAKSDTKVTFGGSPYAAAAR